MVCISKSALCSVVYPFISLSNDCAPKPFGLGLLLAVGLEVGIDVGVELDVEVGLGLRLGLDVDVKPSLDVF